MYTFCLSRPTERNRHHFPCDWPVGMSGKNNGPIRVGSGRYDWHFTRDARCLVERLIITIDVMEIVPASQIEPVMGWITDLPYRWCTPAEAVAHVPKLEGLDVIEQYLNGVRPIEPDRLEPQSPHLGCRPGSHPQSRPLSRLDDLQFIEHRADVHP